MSEPVTTTYHDVEIAYDEQANVWRFIARGHERKSSSLALAKEAIDKPDPTEKKPFDKRQAWMLKSFGNPVEVTVTSTAAGGYGGDSYWITEGKTRSKMAAHYLYEKSHKNDAIVSELIDLKKAQEALNQKIESTKARLAKFKE